MRASPLLLATLGAALALPAPAQTAGDTVVVVPGARYRAGAVERALLGRTHRELWTTPIRVPVLDLATFAAGLTPTGEGGGNQTLSLRFRGADGREYAFRSVDKHPGRRTPLPAPLAYVVQDQVASLVPGAGRVAARLMDATGAPHAEPVLFVMPDDPRLGAFRARFAGVLGELEERPGPGFQGAAEVEDTDDLLERIEASPDERVDAREYLAVRLHLVLGDWDRHADQYRWARHAGPGEIRWRPVPRDRDYAMVDYDGLLVELARPVVPNAVRFRPGLGDGARVLAQGDALDRRLLGGLPRSAWDSVAAEVRAGLTDALIADAVARLTAEHAALQGGAFAATLRARRDDLPRAAAAFYARLAREAEVHATDADEHARIEHLPGGALEVTIRRAGGEDAPPHVHRRFVPGETREVRVWLRGGADRAVVTGAGPILVRVLGGGGDDVLEDRGTGRTAFYDARGDDRFVRGPRTRVDTRTWDPPVRDAPAARLAAVPRDWGTRAAAVSPAVEIRPHAGLVVGAGPSRTRYGFRRHPDAVHEWARVLWAPGSGRFGVEAMHRRRWTGSAAYGYAFGRASALEAVAFGGFGNDAPAHGGGRRAVVWERQLLAEAGVSVPRSGGVTLQGGAVLRHTDPARAADAAGGGARGVDAPWRAAGARAGIRIDRRGERRAGSGWTLALGGAAYPLTAGDAAPYGRAQAVGTAHLPLGAGPVVALRAGGAAAWGGFPAQEAVFLGGSRTVRGLGTQRFAGDRAAYGTVEVRQPLGGGAGVLALTDAGRVWYRGESPGGWHTAVGAGGWVEALGTALTFTVARAERPVASFHVGLPF